MFPFVHCLTLPVYCLQESRSFEVGSVRFPVKAGWIQKSFNCGSKYKVTSTHIGSWVDYFVGCRRREVGDSQVELTEFNFLPSILAMASNLICLKDARLFGKSLSHSVELSCGRPCGPSCPRTCRWWTTRRVKQSRKSLRPRAGGGLFL